MIYVVGNSIAALSVVSETSKLREVTWIRKSGRLGGVFGGLLVDGAICDIGMINFELGAAINRKNSSIINYNRQRINDCANFCEVVSSFVTQFSEIIELPEPKMLFRGRVIPDFLFGHQLDVLNLFQEDLSRTIDIYADELFQDLHPRNKYANGLVIEKVKYQELSRRLLGDMVQNEIIDPWLTKLIGEHAPNLPVSKHRAAWAPLYYPETLIDANKNAIYNFGLNASFSYPITGSISSMILDMFEDIGNSSNVNLVESTDHFSKIVHGALSSENCERVIACEPFTFSEFGLNEFPAPSPKTLIDLVYVRVDNGVLHEDFYVINSCEANIPWYRLSVCNGRISTTPTIICIEAAAGKIGETAELKQLGLLELGITDENSQIVARFESLPALHLIDDVWDMDYGQKLEELKSIYPQLRAIGAAGGRWSNTFSDQVIQGIRESELL